MGEHVNSPVFNIRTNLWFTTPVREKWTTESIYVRVDQIDAAYKFCVIGGEHGGPNECFSGGKHIEGYLISKPGEYALKNYVVEDKYNSCHIMCRPWDDKEHHIQFCWSPGSSKQYQYPEIIEE